MEGTYMRTHILWPDMPPIFAPGRVTQDYFLHFLGFLFVPIWVFVFFSLPVDVDAGFVRTSDYEMAWSVAPRRDLRRCGTIALVFDLTGSVLRCEQDENKNGAPCSKQRPPSAVSPVSAVISPKGNFHLAKFAVS